jgi:hypothetical protein
MRRHGADPLFVHHSAYYSPRIGSVPRWVRLSLDGARLAIEVQDPADTD